LNGQQITQYFQEEINKQINIDMSFYKVPQLIPYVGKEELKNLEEVIAKQWITEGPFSQKFIEIIKEFTGAKYAVLANNGTLALYLSILALDIGIGDEVIVPNFTFIASGTSIIFAGAKPVFIDVDIDNLNIDVTKIESAITEKTKAIMPVHLYGQAADMDPILKIAKKYNLKVIEDAAQGYGVYYKDKHTGTIGNIGMISFFADKTVTTGEGAVILTNNKRIYEKLNYLRNQGRLSSGTFEHLQLGMNFRMTDLQCAVGVAQLRKFELIKKIKTDNYLLYRELLSDVDEVSFIRTEEYSNFVPFRVNLKVKNQAGLSVYLEENGIQTRGFFFPMHRQPCLKYLGYKKEEFPISNKLNSVGLSLPVFCDLTEHQINYICEKIKEFYEKY
jgi:perosamine synthetase